MMCTAAPFVQYRTIEDLFYLIVRAETLKLGLSGAQRGALQHLISFNRLYDVQVAVGVGY